MSRLDREKPRSQRRAEERERNKKRNQQRLRNNGVDEGRRHFLKFAAAGTALTVTGGGAFLWARSHGESEGLVNSDPTAIIMEEVQKEGIMPSAQEQAIWRDGYQKSSAPITSDSDGKIYDGRLFSTLQRMLDSENPYFRDASAELKDKVESGLVRIIRLQANVLGADTSGGVGYGPNNGRFDYEFNISQDFVLNQSSALTLAGVILHETTHLRQYEAFRASISQLSPTEQASRMHAFFDNESALTTLEADAYGKEAEGQIYEAGLLGRVSDTEFSGWEERAAAYIKADKNVNNPKWIKELKRIDASGIRTRFSR